MSTVAIPHVSTVEHAEAPVDVWYQPPIADEAGLGEPLEAVVALEVGFPGKDCDDPVFVPASIARQVAQAILDALPE